MYKFPVYWTDKLKVDFLQRVILIHSYLYYEADNSVWGDRKYDEVAKQLKKEAKGVPFLTVFTFGVVVKLFYEAIETIDPGPIEALTAVGANKLQIIHFAVMPQILTYFISYVLYAFEINVRASTVLGYIGAGGIGLYLQQTLQVFDYAKTGMIILVIIVVVVIIDYISTKSREALMK